MPFAAVLTRASRRFYLRLLRFFARKGISGSGYVLSQCYGILQIYKPPAHSVKESGFFSAFLRGLGVSALSLLFARKLRRSTRTTLAPFPCICYQGRCFQTMHGMAARMIRPLMRKLPLILGCSLLAAALPSSIHAQFVRKDATPPPQRASAKPESQNSASAETPQGKKRISQEVQLTGEATWLDTGIDVQAGEHVLVTATGKLRYADAKDDNGPEGLPRGFKDLLRVLPFNEAGRGALIGRIGDNDIAQPFVVGARRDVLAPVSGRISVGINQTTDDTGDGTYAVRIEVYTPEGGTARVVAKQVSSLRGIDNDLFSKIPRRISDKQGNPGDMVNFLILGSEAAMQRVFTTAGWVKVDASVEDTVLHGVIGSLSKESYLTMPMSQLYLFGRPQDYGWAHAEPISVVRSRNHLRLWKAPFEANGKTLWVGAATHDIGFERDQRNNGITHKIDPDIDLERDYVEKTLAFTGLVAEISHFLPDNPMKEAKTATGGTFHSNGQVLILKLDESAPNP
jgi:LssY C-terminus